MPSTLTSMRSRFAGQGRRRNESVLYVFGFDCRCAVARDVGVLQSRRTRVVVADVAIGDSALVVLVCTLVEWEPTAFADDVLEGSAARFTEQSWRYKPDREFFVAEAFWPAARRQPDRADGARSELRAPAHQQFADHAGESDAARVGRW